MKAKSWLRDTPLVGAALAWSLGLWAAGAAPAEVPKETMVIAGEIFQLELALTSNARQNGLMGRTEITPNGGMLFVFSDCRPRDFWMAGTLVDIDIIFLDAAARVTAVHTMCAEAPQSPHENEQEYSARLPRYSSRLPAQFAIELKAGSLALLGLQPGDTVALDGPRLRALASPDF